MVTLENVSELTKLTSNLKTYKELDEEGNLLKQYELVNGSWLDVTARELAKIEIEKAKQELQKPYI